jgi:hypothetical protein
MTAKYTDSSDPPLGYSEFESQDYFSVVTKGKELYYDVTIFELGSIDLSCNDLSGEIPVEIARLDAWTVQFESFKKLFKQRNSRQDWGHEVT